MDRLIKAEVQVLDMAFTRGQKCSQTFKLTNLMHTMPVAVSLTTSNPSLFTFTQPLSTIPPLSTASYTIHLAKPRDQPPLSTPPDTILVQSSMLPTGKASQEDLRRLFSKPGPHIFKDARISLVFVGPHVAEHLLSPSKTSLETESPLFSKAISSCDRSQLASLLRIGVKNGKVRLVSLLIEAGADVNHRHDHRDSCDESLLDLAVRCGNPNIVETLIRSGCVVDNDLDLVLHHTAAMNRVDLMEILCLGYADLDLNSRDSRGQTALHVASIHGQIEALKFLISIGSEVDVTDDEGYTPLHYASESGDSDAVEHLLNHSIFSKHAVTKDEKKTPFDLAVERGNTDLYDALRLGDRLHEAARKGDVREISNCLDNGAKVNGRDQNGWTHLHRAAFKGHLESVKLLVGRGARVDLADRADYTPLLRAIDARQVDVATFLVCHGSNKSKSVMSFKDHPSSLLSSLHRCQVKERA